MDFRHVLIEAFKICGEHADDPFLLYSALCDCARNDYTVSPQVEMFHRFNKTYGLVAEMKRNPEPRMIGTLLERCREQPDAPKSCLKWIYTIFEFYYRAKHGEQKDTEQILQSLEADLFEPEFEGLDLPNPKPKQKKAGAKCTPKVNTPNPAPANATPQLKSPLPLALPQRMLLTRKRRPYTKYKSFPDDTYVYMSANTPIIHISSQCPKLNPPYGFMILYRGSYKKARDKDFAELHHFYDSSLAQNYTPLVCSLCGDFKPEVPGQVNPRIYLELK